MRVAPAATASAPQLRGRNDLCAFVETRGDFGQLAVGGADLDVDRMRPAIFQHVERARAVGGCCHLLATVAAATAHAAGEQVAQAPATGGLLRRAVAEGGG